MFGLCSFSCLMLQWATLGVVGVELGELF